MMAVEALRLLTSSSLFMILLFQLVLFQTSVAKPNYNCTPSACGIFPNISSPLRLKGDPKHCGLVELTCENNVTSFYLNSLKFYVKQINYTRYTMRVVDASVNNDTCSFPATSSAITGPFIYIFDSNYQFSSGIWPMYFMSCPHPLKNSSLFTETTPCQTPNSSRFTYIRVGFMMASEVPETCRVDVMAMTSWRGFKDFENASLEEINTALLYGFDLRIYPPSESTKWGKFVDYYSDKVKVPLLILLAIAVVFGAAISPMMAIIGFIVVLGFLLSLVSYHFHNRILWWDTFDPLNIYTVVPGVFDPWSVALQQILPSCQI